MAGSTKKLRSYWNAQREDNFSTATDVGRASAKAAGYHPVRVEGLVYEGPVSGSIPLTLFWSQVRGDNFTATPAGESAARAAGYESVRVEGHILTARPVGACTRLRSWWSSKRGDNFLTGSSLGDHDAEQAGYERVRIVEGFGPAVRAIEVDRTGHENFQTGVADWYEGRHFTPGGRVFSVAISTAVGLPRPEYALGVVFADGDGRIKDLSLRTVDDHLPDVAWTGIIIDAESGSEVSVGPVH